MGAKLRTMEQYLTQFQRGDWEGACRKFMPDDFECIEPPELPQGGVFLGWDAPIVISNIYRAIWDIEVLDAQFFDEESSDILVSRYLIQWTSKETGHSMTQPVVELNTIKNGQILKMEVFHFDAAGLIATLGG